MADDNQDAASPKVKALRKRYAAEMARMAARVVELLDRESDKPQAPTPAPASAPATGQAPETGPKLPKKRPPRRDGYMWWDRGAPLEQQPRGKDDPREYHSLWVESRQPKNWVRDGGKISGWWDRER